MIWTTVEKRMDWNRLYEFDFSWAREVSEDSETLSSPSVPAVSGITIGSPVVNGSVIEVTISGGAVGGGTTLANGTTAYVLTCTVTTSGGRTLSMLGYLQVVA